MAIVSGPLAYKDFNAASKLVRGLLDNVANEYMPATVLYGHDGTALTADIGNGTYAIRAMLLTMAQVIGSVAHDSPDTQPPVKVGGRASTSLRTAVADDDRVDGLWDADGALIIRRSAHAVIVSGNASNTDGNATQLIAAGATGVKTYLTWATLTNTHASTFAYVELKDGTTVKATIPVPPSSGAVVRFEPPLVGTAATAWNFDPSAAVTTLICSAGGYQSKA